MDLLNRAYTQLYVLFRSMTPGGRLTVGAAAVLVLLGLAYLSVHEASPTYVDLMHGMPIAAADLPAMEAALGRSKLNRYEIRGTSIYVPRGHEADYMAALATGKALPKGLGAALFEAVTTGSWYDIGSERDRERMKVAKQMVLSQIIGEMRGIERAYVLFDVDNRPGGFKDKLITASACVVPAGSGQLDQRLVPAIRDMLVTAIAGLKPENVTVSDLTGHTWRGASQDDVGSGESRYHSLKRISEQDLKAKILNALWYIPDVAVETNVELSTERVSRENTTRQAGSAASDQHGGAQPVSNGRTSTTSLTPLQRPNMAAMLKAVIGGSQEDDSRESDAPSLSLDKKSETESINPTPTAARVSVSVPIGYFREVWRQQNPAYADSAPDPASLERIRLDESAKIQKHVAQLLPISDSVASATDVVTVTAFPDIAPERLPPPTFSEELLRWARQSWRTLGIIALGLMALLTLRSMVRTRPAAAATGVTAATRVASYKTTAEADAEVDATGPHASQRTAETPRAPRPHARRFHDASPSTRDELSELIAHDPDTAANVLRNWIGQVG